MTAFTPGPWRMEEGATYAGPPMVCAGNGVVIGGFMGANTKSVAEDNANARLCAAAPDLLAACETMIGLLTNDGTWDGGTYTLYERGAVAQMKAAIEKARGDA